MTLPAGSASARAPVPSPGRAPRAAASRLARLARLARGPIRSVARLAVAAPLSSALVVALWAIGVATGAVVTGPSESVLDAVAMGLPSLAAGHWWAPASSAVFSSGLPGYLAVSVLLLGVGAPMERRIGTWRASLLVVICQVGGSLLAMALIGFGARAGDLWAASLSEGVTVGIAPGVLGMVLAGSSRLHPLWRRRLRVLAMATLLVMVLYAGDLADMVRLAGGAVGLTVGLLRPGRGSTEPAVRTGGDRRFLVAAVVAAAALGPLSAVSAGRRHGPLSLLDFLFLPSLDADDVATWCSAVHSAAQQACLAHAGAFLLQGIGPLFQTLLPVLVMVTLAEGLRRGRRAAYLGVVAVNVVLAALGAVLSHRELTDLLAESPSHVLGGPERWMLAMAPIAVPLFTAVIVVIHRQEFTVRMPWRVHRLWVLGIAGMAAVTFVGYVSVGWAARDQFRPIPSIIRIIASFPGRITPVGYLAAGHDRLFPAGPVAVGLYRWTGAAFWAVVVVLTALHFWRSRPLDVAPGRSRATEVLRRDSGGSLGYITLWRGNHYFFTDDRTTFIAYRVIAGVAVTTGDPVGPRPGTAIEAFVEHCAQSGWTPCFFSVTERVAALLRAEDFHTLPVAVDTVIDPQQLTFTGKRWQDVRSARSRAEREGVTALWARFHELPAALADQVAAIDRQWLAGKELPEMGFTLGGLAELDDPQVRCVLAVDGDGRVLAVTSWLPGFHGGRVVGWTLDFMRRGPLAFPGAMEFLIAAALSTFRDEGCAWASLSGVPLAWPDGEQPLGGMGRAMAAVGGALEPVYGFRSLLAFKAKFDPEYRPLYLAYPSAAALPTVTNAVLRAYVPHLAPAQLGHLVRRLVRPHSTGA